MQHDKQCLEFLQHPDWTGHRRGEANFQLNNSDLFLRSEYGQTALAEVLFAIYLTRVYFNADGAVEELQAQYEARAQHRMGEGARFDIELFLEGTRHHRSKSQSRSVGGTRHRKSKSLSRSVGGTI